MLAVTTLQPGGTPYVRDQADLKRFLATLDGYLAYFTGALGGRPETPLQFHQDCPRGAPGAASAAAI